VIDRSETQNTPKIPLAPQTVLMFGTCVAETILASVHVRTPRKAGHMNASDQIKLSRAPLGLHAVDIKGVYSAERLRIHHGYRDLRASITVRSLDGPHGQASTC